MLLQDARRDARLDADGDLVLLEEQDRSRWDRAQIGEALPLVEEALRGGPGPFALQAAIAALHCQAARPETRTGRKSCACTTFCSASTRPPSWPLTGRWRWLSSRDPRRRWL